jgi:hypothetical protein
MIIGLLARIVPSTILLVVRSPLRLQSYSTFASLLSPSRESSYLVACFLPVVYNNQPFILDSFLIVRGYTARPVTNRPVAPSPVGVE